MKSWYSIVIIAVVLVELMLAQHDGDFDDIDHEDFDDAQRTHYHDHDDDGSFEARKSLEHVSFIISVQLSNSVFWQFILYASNTTGSSQRRLTLH